MKGKNIFYKHPNGYSARLYGKASLIIYDPQGNEQLHTAARTCNTEDEVMQMLEEQPDFMALLRGK